MESKVRISFQRKCTASWLFDVQTHSRPVDSCWSISWRAAIGRKGNREGGGGGTEVGGKGGRKSRSETVKKDGGKKRGWGGGNRGGGGWG